MFFSILVFLIVLSILVLVHELGHFIAARRAGILVEEFGFGLPPRVIGKRIGETLYSLNLLPFGGFVKLYGEEQDNTAYPQRAFINKDKKTRAAVIVSGVIMNFLLGIFAFSSVYFFSGIPKETQDVKVVDVASGSPAQTGGIVVGDIVRKVDAKEISKVDEFVKLVEEKKGRAIVLLIARNSETLKITLVPRENPPQGEGPLGVTITTTEIYFPPAWQRPAVSLYYGAKDAFFWAKTIILGLAKTISELFVGQIPKDLAGPVGIFAVTSKAAQVGILALVNFLGIISINLAILNIVPFPALDGGRLLFVGIEAFFGKRVIPKVEAAVHTVGMIILLTLLLAITVHDIRRLISAGGISGFIDNALK